MAPTRFGTDGVRGVANEELTPELALAIGRAAARVLPAPTFVVGRDTRRSGPLLQAAFSAGLAAHAAAVEGGLDVVDLFGLREPQRLLGDHLVGEDREVRRERTPVDGDLAGAVAHAHARNRFLTATGRLNERLGQGASFARRQAPVRARARDGNG